MRSAGRQRSTTARLLRQLSEPLGQSAGVAERDLVQALMDCTVDTLRQLGTGFRIVGRHFHFDV
jgi:hypothetical protein